MPLSLQALQRQSMQLREETTALKSQLTQTMKRRTGYVTMFGRLLAHGDAAPKHALSFEDLKGSKLPVRLTPELAGELGNMRQELKDAQRVVMAEREKAERADAEVKKLRVLVAKLSRGGRGSLTHLHLILSICHL